MAIEFTDIEDLIEFTREYAGLGQHVADQLEELRGGERLPSDVLSQDAVQHYIVPFLHMAMADYGVVFPELPPQDGNFEYLYAPKLDSFTVTVTVKMMAEDEHDTQGVNERIRNALETEGLNIYSNLKVEKL